MLDYMNFMLLSIVFHFTQILYYIMLFKSLPLEHGIESYLSQIYSST